MRTSGDSLRRLGENFVASRFVEEYSEMMQLAIDGMGIGSYELGEGRTGHFCEPKVAILYQICGTKI
jgi:hypothetical protein